MSEVSSEVTSSESVAPESTPSPVTPESTTPTSEVSPTVDAAPVPYTPDYKYKVYGQEKEIPENFRNFIKSQEEEKSFKELFEKADAIEGFKTKNEEARNRYAQLESTVKEHLAPRIQYYDGLVQSLKTSVDKEDFSGVCEAMGIDPTRLLGLAAKEAQLRQDPNAYRAAQAERAREQAMNTAQSHVSKEQQRTMEVEAQYINRMLDYKVQDPTVKQYADAFDARMGKPGAFVQQIRQLGEYQYLTGNKDVDPAGLIESYMKMHPMAQTMSTNTSAAPASVAPVQTQSKPTIPTVNGGTGSSVPSKKAPTSIKEMKQAWTKSRNGG